MYDLINWFTRCREIPKILAISVTLTRSSGTEAKFKKTLV